MKKFFIVIMVAIVALISSGCNKTLFDTTYLFETAIIMLPDGEVIKGQVQSWTDYEDGDQIQVKIDGKTYLVHAENICLIAGEG